jgi:murein DD-endopeptidase / murein LD-carboxypeptidase
MNQRNFLLLFFSFLLFSNIAISQSVANTPDSSSIQKKYLKEYYTQLFGFSIDTIKNPNLYCTIEEWLDTRYRYGGHNKGGIDCSGFVKAVLDSAYKIQLDGGSGSLYQQVVPLETENLKEGDLVFFKIKKKRISHVGIYLGNNKFAHASTELGVIISDLNEPYYKKRYYKGGRLKTFVASNQ